MTHMQAYRTVISPNVIPPKPQEADTRVPYDEAVYAQMMARTMSGKSKPPMPRNTQTDGENSPTKHKPQTVAKWKAVCDLIVSSPGMTKRQIMASAGGATEATVLGAINWASANGYIVDRTRQISPRYTMTKVGG